MLLRKRLHFDIGYFEIFIRDEIKYVHKLPYKENTH